MNLRSVEKFRALGMLLACVAAPPLASAQSASALRDAGVPNSKLHGLDLAGMDRAVKPGDDFFAFANGTWVDKTEIPQDRSHWGIFATLAEATALKTRALLEGAAASNIAGNASARRAGDFYASAMDEAGVEAAGISPLAPELTRVAALADKKALAKY